jgi:protein gp37
MNKGSWYSWANGQPYKPTKGGPPKMVLDTKMLASWARARKPKKRFVCSMTDIFGEWVPDEMILQILDAMTAAPEQTFQVLTKRPEHMAYMAHQWILSRGGWQLPPNIWLGISAEDQQRLDERLIWLIRTQAQTRFLSLEPLLGPIIFPDSDSDTAMMLQEDNPAQILEPIDYIDWVIIGGESGPNARPMNLDWLRDILDQCRAANIPAFVKQLGTAWAKEVGAKDTKGGNPDEWPPDFRVRMWPGDSWADMPGGQL